MIKLGTIINVRGLKGEVKIESSTSFAKLRYVHENEIVLSNGKDELIVHPIHYSFYNGYDYVIFDEIKTVEEANKYRNYDVLIDNKFVNKLDNAYYFYELIGLTVLDQDNNKLGEIIEVFDNPGNQIIRVKGEKEFLVPFVKQFIIKVDLENKVIVINKMEGLV